MGIWLGKDFIFFILHASQVNMLVVNVKGSYYVHSLVFDSHGL